MSNAIDFPTELMHKDGNGDTIIYLYYINSTCKGSDVRQTFSPNNVAFQMVLEGGGVYCVSN
ncbi:MAG: hypothetical protein KIG14_03505 [Candidatus Sacchiramonaceae bacterium]|nr:hypothetical protein [Candidatus Saccharimonadaceae bacterium]